MLHKFESYLKTQMIEAANKDVYISHLITIGLIILATIILLWVIKRILIHRLSRGTRVRANLVAFIQLIQYMVWIIAFLFVLESLGVKLTMFFAGSAALLVGVGIGLQQTFNDFISGIIILVERTIKIGDILEIDGHVVKVQAIRLRTSRGLDRDDISMIIPNSHIVTNKLINWSHQSKNTRFMIPVGVAYSSNVEQIVQLLEECVKEHESVSDHHPIEVRLTEFSPSTLSFQVLFFSDHIFRIERIKSDIRKAMVVKFREHGISFPFPQLDVHLKKEV